MTKMIIMRTTSQEKSFGMDMVVLTSCLLLPEGQSDQSLSDKHDNLKELFKTTWNDTEISSLMNATYILHRQDLVGKKLNVAQMKEEWSFRSELRAVC